MKNKQVNFKKSHMGLNCETPNHIFGILPKFSTGGFTLIVTRKNQVKVKSQSISLLTIYDCQVTAIELENEVSI